MIIIKVQGGLGNQLFQYAFGRLLEVKYGKTVAYDVSFYTVPNAYTVRYFHLNRFHVVMRIATDDEIRYTRYPYGLLSKGISLCKKALNKYITKKYQVAYDEKMLQSLEKKDTAYLEGFWQSYRYCLPIMDKLQQELTLTESICVEAQEYIQKIPAYNSVAVHIRRGDYLNSGKDLQALTEEYYTNAVAYIETKIENPHYFIFSDDIHWVKKTLHHLFKDATYVTGQIFKDYEELALMSLCKHAIIANSTFSWWGAMLNINNTKIVISPKDWKNIHFRGDTNLCPEEWIKI